ncbi:unnamed protein product [Brassica rapa]|uniref:FRIGIDA-like protein n=1 Tax=Brassica campestris TaxID=3711 RepID=A0A8D9I4S3_BRACM|nr:unnamed protein product [Brassica rapa]
MYECGRTDGFEPVSVLKGYVKEAREAAERVCKEDKYSLKSQNEATDKEVSALRAVIKIIKDRGLEAEFSEERVEERVEELERQKAQRKRNVEPPQPKPKGRKRPRDPRGGFIGPYTNQLAPGLYNSAAPPQSVYYGQQTGFVMPPFHPAYYSQ